MWFWVLDLVELVEDRVVVGEQEGLKVEGFGFDVCGFKV